MNNINSQYRMLFEYDQRGYGELMLYSGDDPIGTWWSRSGSIDKTGTLKNVIEAHTWYLISGPEEPHSSEYELMRVHGKPGFGWKQRLWPIPTPTEHFPRSRYLVHPDGGLPGSRGCIVTIQTNAMDFYYWCKWFFVKEPRSIVRLDIHNREERDNGSIT